MLWCIPPTWAGGRFGKDTTLWRSPTAHDQMQEWLLRRRPSNNGLDVYSLMLWRRVPAMVFSTRNRALFYFGKKGMTVFDEKLNTHRGTE